MPRTANDLTAVVRLTQKQHVLVKHMTVDSLCVHTSRPAADENK